MVMRNLEAATLVGKAIMLKATAAGIKEIAFDRSGFRFHGRIKVAADAARKWSQCSNSWVK